VLLEGVALASFKETETAVANTPVAEAPDLMKEDEAAALLRQAAKTLKNQRSRREGPPYVRLPNGQIRYSRRALLKYVAENTVDPRCPAA
jgi:hypothetical protein